MNNKILTGVWAALHSNYATVEELEAVRKMNSDEHKELRELVTNNHNEIKDMFIKYLGDRK